MPPKFSLQSILEYHHNRVEKLEMELGLLNQQKKSIEEMIERLSAKKIDLYDELVAHQEGELDLKMIDHIRQNINHIQLQVVQQTNKKAETEKAISKKRVELVDAKKEEAVFEKLKEKEHEQWLEKVNQSEKDALSDLYISQAFRQGMLGSRFGDD